MKKYKVLSPKTLITGGVFGKKGEVFAEGRFKSPIKDLLKKKIIEEVVQEAPKDKEVKAEEKPVQEAPKAPKSIASSVKKKPSTTKK